MVFSLAKWLALTLPTTGSIAMRKRVLKRLDKVWSKAGVALKKKGTAPTLIFVGAFNLALSLEPGAPLAVKMQLDPVSILVPDIPHDRERVRQQLK